MVLDGMGVVSVNPVLEILRGMMQYLILLHMDGNSQGRVVTGLKQGSVRLLTTELED